jgi:predicted MFS family arabinose efflux permease
VDVTGPGQRACSPGNPGPASKPLADSRVTTHLQRATPPHLLGRVLANVYGGVGVAAAVGYLAGGPRVDATSLRIAFVIVGCGGLAGAAVTAALLRRARRRPGPDHRSEQPQWPTPRNQPAMAPHSTPQ